MNFYKGELKNFDLCKIQKYIGEKMCIRDRFIHAASGQGKVVINNLNSTYYVNAYVNARRVL